MDKVDKDRIEGIGDDVAGNVKESVGKATDDERLEGEGQGQQVKGDIKKGVADAKDKLDDAVDKLKGQ